MDKKYINEFFKSIDTMEQYELFSLTLPLTLIYKSAFNATEQLVKEKYDLLHSDIDVLASLYFNGKILSPTELYSAMIFSSGGMTKILKKLECLGYISRVSNPNDKRSNLVKLEQSGEEVLLNCLEDIIEDREPMFDVLSLEERENLKIILKKIMLNLE